MIELLSTDNHSFKENWWEHKSAQVGKNDEVTILWNISDGEIQTIWLDIIMKNHIENAWQITGKTSLKTFDKPVKYKEHGI